jgi:hypothetical protein
VQEKKHQGEFFFPFLLFLFLFFFFFFFLVIVRVGFLDFWDVNARESGHSLHKINLLTTHIGHAANDPIPVALVKHDLDACASCGERCAARSPLYLVEIGYRLSSKFILQRHRK